MKVHEHQAKALLREAGVPVPRGDVATTPGEARAVAGRLGGRVVVKAQVHAGGRGKAGGIKLADDAAAAEAAAGRILGMRLRTPQTPPEGIPVRAVLVEEASAVERELYLSVTLDRARGAHVVMASQAGYPRRFAAGRAAADDGNLSLGDSGMNGPFQFPSGRGIVKAGQAGRFQIAQSPETALVAADAGADFPGPTLSNLERPLGVGDQGASQSHEVRPAIGNGLFRHLRGQRVSADDRHLDC